MSDYSAEQPYLSLNTNLDGNVVATGDGMVVTVESDDTYAHIIEVEHNNGYKSRYMCRQEAQTQIQAGAQVQAGDILLTFVEPNFRKYAFPQCREAKFVLAKLGNDAGIYGAAALILRNNG